jgi:hypothetical protein
MAFIISCMLAVPDLPVCLITGPCWQAKGGGGGHLPAKLFFYNEFLLLWCNFKFEGVLFRSDSRHNDRVDSLCECPTKQAVSTQVRGIICPKSDTAR